MQNDKKDLNAILASLDPKLREKIELPVQKKEEKPAEQAAETADTMAEEIAEAVSETAPEEIPEHISEAPTGKLDEAPAALDPKLRDAIGCDGEKAPVKDKLTEAEEKAAAILEFEGSHKAGVEQKSSAAYLAVELLVLEIIAFLLFFATFRSEEWGGVGLIAMLMPAIVGILMRMFRDQLSLKEAVSKCKFHIFLSLFFLICVMLTA